MGCVAARFHGRCLPPPGPACYEAPASERGSAPKRGRRMTTRFRATVFCAALAALPARADVTLQLFADVAADLRHDASRTHADFSSNHLDFFGSASRERFSL